MLVGILLVVAAGVVYCVGVALLLSCDLLGGGDFIWIVLLIIDGGGGGFGNVMFSMFPGGCLKFGNVQKLMSGGCLNGEDCLKGGSCGDCLKVVVMNS